LRALVVVALIGCAAPPRVGSPCVGPPGFAPFDAAAPPAPAHEPADGILDAFVAWYQDQRAPLRPGEGCRFAPSCSAYARIALHRYGPLGLIFVIDRLIVREHAWAATSYPVTCIDHMTKLADAVP
jgi:putative component of membrane protein insertase Oxa1/YidC/SpoIIIJ protein YidD